MTTGGSSDERPMHRFAWDGFSFLIPLDWDLSFYHFDKRVSSIRMEDESAVRMEMDWTRPRGPVQMAKVRERYGNMAGAMEAVAEEARPLEDLPVGWSAFVYRMEDRRRLVTAFWLDHDGGFFCFFRLHFERGGSRAPARVVRALAASFERHEGGRIPWEVYDLSFELGRDFYLAGTALQAGRKLMRFQWRLRKLYLWQFSLAHILLRDKALGDWAAEFLNGTREFKGVRFVAEGEETVSTKKRYRYPFGHYDEIARRCFRYDVRVALLPDKDAVVLVVFNYRKPDDLKHLAGMMTGDPSG